MPPSRALSSSDGMLSPRVWMDVEKRWGPHSVDLMTLDSNTPLDVQGHPLKHFTPLPTQNSAGVNVFSQTLHHLDNAFVFPLLALTGILPRFLDSQPCPFTIIVPDPFPGVTGGLLSLGVLKILSASVFWVTKMCYYFSRQQEYSFLVLCLGTLGHLEFFPNSELNWSRTPSRFPEFGAQPCSVVSVRIHTTTAFSFANSVGFKDFLVSRVSPPKGLND